MGDIQRIEDSLFQGKEYQDQPLSVKRGSITLQTTDGQEVVKSYHPNSFPNYHASTALFRCSDSFLRNPKIGEETARYCFQKVSRIYAFSASLPPEERFTPDLIGVHPGSLSIVSERVPYDNFRSYFLHGNSKRRKTEELVDALIALHGTFGHNLKELYTSLQWGSFRKKTFGLRIRRAEEESSRLQEQLRTIVYRCSEGFADYSQFKHRKGHWRTSQVIDEYLEKEGINLKRFISEFLGTHSRLVYGEERLSLVESLYYNRSVERVLEEYQNGKITIIHGDFNPQNIFVLPPESRNTVLVCDPQEMRLDQRHIDLVSAIYNIYNAPKQAQFEPDSLELIKRYVQGVKDSEGIDLGLEGFLVETLETRLKEVIRLFAADCRFTIPQIKEYVTGLSEFELRNEDQLRTHFLQTMFVDNLGTFSDYVLGEGSGHMFHFPKIDLLRQQVSMVHEFLTQSGVMASLSAGAQRRDKVRNLVEVG